MCKSNRATILVLLGLLLAGCGVEASPTPPQATAGRTEAAPLLTPTPVARPPTPAAPPTASRTVDKPTPAPTTLLPSPLPTAPPTIVSTGSDLSQYFAPFVGWVRHIPAWMREPPADRQVVHLTKGPTIDYETLLLDREGTTLARFTEADGGTTPGEILWSWDKERAVVEFHYAGGTAISFFIIDRDGNRLGSPLAAYWGPMWSPTQNLLAYHNSIDDRLYIVDGDGTPVVVSEPFSPRPCIVCSVPPQWSPDGKRVALIAYIGDVARTTDIPLCFISLDQTVTCTSLLAYHLKGIDMHWLDDRYLLLRSTAALATTVGYRYLVYDTETEGVREVGSSADLTPVPTTP